ncbi:MAG: mechanosensitive ion channel family protein [Candidatus Aquirickettsiella sp.]
MQTLFRALLQFCMLKALIILTLTAILCFLLPLFYQKYKRRLERKPNILSVALLESIYKPLMILIAIMGILYALEALCIDWKGITTTNPFHLIRNLLFTGLLAWFLWRFVSFSKEAFLNSKNKTRNKTIDKTLIHGLSQIAKLAIIILTALSLFQIFGFSIAGVLAFGGMGGIVIGFAAKDLLSNLFGSCMLFLDRPFVIGDQISLPALKVEGTVEEIGWRVCRIRTPDCRPVYIPNALFSNLVVENPSRMRSRRFYCRISLRYQDLMKVPIILEDMHLILKNNTAIDQKRPITVNLNELGNTSLNLVVMAYTHIVNSLDFLKLQQALFLELLACIQQHGAEWSFPSHNVYLNKEGTELVASQNQNNKQLQ